MEEVQCHLQRLAFLGPIRLQNSASFHLRRMSLECTGLHGLRPPGDLTSLDAPAHTSHGLGRHLVHPRKSLAGTDLRPRVFLFLGRDLRPQDLAVEVDLLPYQDLYRRRHQDGPIWTLA